jgi:hypothetical protein
MLWIAETPTGAHIDPFAIRDALDGNPWLPPLPALS